MSVGICSVCIYVRMHARTRRARACVLMCARVRARMCTLGSEVGQHDGKLLSGLLRDQRVGYLILDD